MIPKKYKYVLTDRLGTIEVAPMNEGDFAISYDKEDDVKYFYSQNFSGKIVFSGATYFRLKSIEESMYLCSEQTLQIFRICGTEENLIFQGVFKIADGSWNNSRCIVDFKFQKIALDKCLNDKKSTKVNILGEILTKVKVKTSSPAGGTYETKNCTKHITVVTDSTGPRGYVWCGLDEPGAQAWQVYQHSEEMSGIMNPGGGGSGVYDAFTNWVREIIILPAGGVPDDEMVLIQNNSDGSAKYARPAILYGCSYNNVYTNDFSYSYNENCSYLGDNTLTQEIDNGMLLNDVLDLLVRKFCSGLTAKSEFFQLNPDTPTDINYVTGLKSDVNNIVLFQKSDVKRPDVANNAWKAEITWEKLTEMLNTLFNVSYSIEAGIIRFEHISWFTRNPGIDLTQPRFQKYIAGRTAYNYDLAGIPQRENFKFKEQRGAPGTIEYSTACAGGADKNNEKNYVIEDFMTDVKMALDNPDSDSNLVEDAGFVVVAARKQGDNYYIISRAGKLNAPFFWEDLLPKYQLHNRYFNKAKINGIDKTMLSVRPIKKGETLTVPFCCGDIFEPSDTVKTDIGDGIVEGAKFNFKTETLELNLSYNAFNNLITNNPPELHPEPLQVYSGEVLDFPINATDTDGTVESIILVTPPLHGTVEILSATAGRYTPSAGFSGYDYFYLKARDNWSEESLLTGWAVTVLPANTPPQASDDYYDVFHDYAFSGVSIFANDSDNLGFEIVENHLTTAQGVNILINSDGTFAYVPPAGFEGTDTFTYTIKDDHDLTSTATVHLRVGYRNKPIGASDIYSAKKNTALTIDGSTIGQQKLTANDYTPDGLTYAYTTTAETKATTQGGSVTITADGLFTYTPAANFTGADSFQYTVHNTNGTGVGNVTVNVFPEIFVKLETVYRGHEDQILYCGTPPVQSAGGMNQKYDFILKFYSDAGAASPLDVTGLGFRVNYEEGQDSSVAGSTSFYSVSGELSGTEYTLAENYYTHEEIASCDYETEIIERNINLAPGAYTII